MSGPAAEPAPRAGGAERDGLDAMRGELRRLGYFTHRLDRFLLQDGLKPQTGWRSLAGGAAKVGLLAGVVLAAVNALALAAANGALERTPFDLLPLFAHLLPPLALGAALVYLGVAAGLTFVLRRTPPRRIEASAFGAAAVTTAAVAAAGLWLGRGLWLLLPRWQLAVAALAAPAVGWALARLFEAAFLGVAIRLTREAPLGRAFGRRALAAGLATLALFLLVTVALSARRQVAVAPAALPQAVGERVLLLGVDGVLAEEVDYLIARGELPALAELAQRGRVARLASGDQPATLWTTVATGVGAERHQVVALDSFRPAGVATALARSGPWRLWWSGVAQPLHLAEHRPLLAGRRLAPFLWELAARGGEPIVAVDWWSTFPADRLPGLVVAHGAYQLLLDGAPGAVAPAERKAELLELARQSARETTPLLSATPLAPSEVERVRDRALLPDRFYRAVFLRALAARPRAAALYLPGLDIAAEGWTGAALPFTDLLRDELGRTDALLAAARGLGFGTIAVVFDPGRRGGGEGRLVLWRAAGCATPPGAAMPALAAETVAATLLRALGLPQSAELPPPALCEWPAPLAKVPSFGERSAAAPPAADEEYLRNLRSLGYL